MKIPRLRYHPGLAGGALSSRRVEVGQLTGRWRVADVFQRIRSGLGFGSLIEGSQMLIQKLRLQRGWSQEQLAELSGLSVRTIQRLERGQAASVESLKALGAAFEIDFTALKEPEMNTTMSQSVSADEALALAHVRKLKWFYIHLAQYVIVVCFLAIVNLRTSPQYIWAIWPALGWGVGILFHGLRVFDKIPFLNGEWERAQVEKYLGRKL
jgi:transcriptional regulator with XRE-family HTH domain